MPYSPIEPHRYLSYASMKPYGRKTPGSAPAFSSPKRIWNKFVDYCKWVEENPVMETKAFHFQGLVIQDEVPKYRIMTVKAFCQFADISPETFHKYGEKHEYKETVDTIRDCIETQKVELAAVQLVCPSFIGKYMGLADKVEQELTGKDGGPIQTAGTKLSGDEMADVIAKAKAIADTKVK